MFRGSDLEVAGPGGAPSTVRAGPVTDSAAAAILPAVRAAGRLSSSVEVIARLEQLARQVRIESVKAVVAANGGHPGGSLSAADVLVALYFTELNVRPEDPRWPGRDRYVHSKGHACEALYATLALRGYFPIEEMATFGQLDSRLQGHPDMTRLPGLDLSTGALGVGFAGAVGMALGSRLRGTDERVYVMLGDGECQEGMVWEGAFVAGKYGLDNLLAIVDFNRLQQFGWPGPTTDERAAPWEVDELAAHWAAARWSVHQINGHSFSEILEGLELARSIRGRPVVLIAHTVKGKGVSFMESRAPWHSRIPTLDELEMAIEELNAPV